MAPPSLINLKVHRLYGLRTSADSSVRLFGHEDLYHIMGPETMSCVMSESDKPTIRFHGDDMAAYLLHIFPARTLEHGLNEEALELGCTSPLSHFRPNQSQHGKLTHI